jgi:rhodanese-related sulfurtransferase
MDIRNFIKTNRLFLAALLIIIVIIVVMLSLQGPDISYKLGSDKVPGLLAGKSNFIDPVSLYKQLSSKSSNAVIIDIRSSDEFGKGHIEKAVNIPVRDLLENHSLHFFRELARSNTEVIMYGETQLQANGPWLLLRQVGIENVKVLQGGYSVYKDFPMPDSLIINSSNLWNVEMSQIDTAAFAKINPAKTVGGNQDDQKSAEKVVPVKKVTSSGGGC